MVGLRLEMVCRFLVVLMLAAWFGGFTFYSTVVISTAQEVLHSHIRAGLITQQVTNWLNLISIPALGVLLANLIGLRKRGSKRWLQILGGSLGIMIALQIALFAVHPVLDRQIVNRDVLDEGYFFKLHRVYLVVSTAQWLATLAYLWSTLTLWRMSDAAER